jgi:hypothetical protein
VSLRQGPRSAKIGLMSRTIWMVIGAVLTVAAGIWMLARRGRARHVKDLGGVSEQWMNEQRAHDGEWRHR